MSEFSLIVEAVDEAGVRERYVFTREDTPADRAYAARHAGRLLAARRQRELSRAWEPPELPP